MSTLISITPSPFDTISVDDGQFLTSFKRYHLSGTYVGDIVIKLIIGDDDAQPQPLPDEELRLSDYDWHMFHRRFKSMYAIYKQELLNAEQLHEPEPEQIAGFTTKQLAEALNFLKRFFDMRAVNPETTLFID